MTPFILFTTSAYDYMREEFHQVVQIPLGEINRKRFADGELHLQLLTGVAEQEVVLIGGTPTDNDFMELVDTATLLAERGARSLKVVIPFFGYSTQERATKPGECRTAKTRARILSGIPARGGCTFYLIDAHTEGLPGYFEGASMCHHLYTEPVLLQAMRSEGGENFVLGSTDAGRAKWIQSYGDKLGVATAIIQKRRGEDGQTRITGFSADVQGKRVLIYDDMIRTGGSLINAAKAYRDHGASEVRAIATHGVLPGEALQRIRASGLIERVILTNSHPRTEKLVLSDASEYVMVVQLERLVIEALCSPDMVV